MLENILISTLISIIIIIIIHNIFLFFQNNLTSPKVKDFVNKPNERYKEIYNIIDNANVKTQNIDKSVNEINNNNKNTTNIDNIPNIIPANNINENLIIENKNDNSMKSELKNFLNSLADT